MLPFWYLQISRNVREITLDLQIHNARSVYTKNTHLWVLTEIQTCRLFGLSCLQPYQLHLAIHISSKPLQELGLCLVTQQQCLGIFADCWMRGNASEELHVSLGWIPNNMQIEGQVLFYWRCTIPPERWRTQGDIGKTSGDVYMILKTVTFLL